MIHIHDRQRICHLHILPLRGGRPIQKLLAGNDRCSVRIAILLLLSAVLAAGQQPEDQASKIRAAMQASLEQQRASVRKQTDSAKPVEPGSFFTIPWPHSNTPVTAAPDESPC